jgi:hypothetical protein
VVALAPGKEVAAEAPKVDTAAAVLPIAKVAAVAVAEVVATAAATVAIVVVSVDADVDGVDSTGAVRAKVQQHRREASHKHNIAS